MPNPEDIPHGERPDLPKQTPEPGELRKENLRERINRYAAKLKSRFLQFGAQRESVQSTMQNTEPGAEFTDEERGELLDTEAKAQRLTENSLRDLQAVDRPEGKEVKGQEYIPPYIKPEIYQKRVQEYLDGMRLALREYLGPFGKRKENRIISELHDISIKIDHVIAEILAQPVIRDNFSYDGVRLTLKPDANKGFLNPQNSVQNEFAPDGLHFLSNLNTDYIHSKFGEFKYLDSTRKKRNDMLQNKKYLEFPMKNLQNTEMVRDHIIEHGRLHPINPDLETFVRDREVQAWEKQMESFLKNPDQDQK